MADLFSTDWAKAYMDAWNTDTEIVSSLAKAGFNAVIGFGLVDEDKPAFVMTIENGMIITVSPKSNAKLNWDIRATEEDWLALIIKPPGLMRVGIAYTSRKLKFLAGDYAAMIRDETLADAFVKAFALMGKVL